MSSSDHEPVDAPPVRDPWPHEHGEHPSGISVPEVRLHPREPMAHLLGEPQPIHHQQRPWGRIIGWIAALGVVAGAIAAVMLL